MAEQAKFAFLVRFTDRYSVKRIEATVVKVTTDGKLHNPSWIGEQSPFADLNVFAYVDKDRGGVWWAGHMFQPHSVELEQAESMVRVFRKINRGLSRESSQQGYLFGESRCHAPTDFAGYLFRVAKTLAIRCFYVESSARVRNMTGQQFRQAKPSDVQTWVAHLEDEICKSEQD